jgi:predicted tellurium resistance membrane protein TerC
MNYTDFQLVLTWVVGMGAPAIVAYVLALVVENWAGWANLSHNIKVLVPMLASILLSVGASMLLKYPAIIAQIQPWFQMTVSAVLAYLASQKGYMQVLEKQYGQRFKMLRAKKQAGLVK